MNLLDDFKSKELSIWAVVIGKAVIDTHVGHPELYVSRFPDEIDVKLIQYSHERGFPKKGDIWDGERFRKNV